MRRTGQTVLYYSQTEYTLTRSNWLEQRRDSRVDVTCGAKKLLSHMDDRLRVWKLSDSAGQMPGDGKEGSDELPEHRHVGTLPTGEHVQIDSRDCGGVKRKGSNENKKEGSEQERRCGRSIIDERGKMYKYLYNIRQGNRTQNLVPYIKKIRLG